MYGQGTCITASGFAGPMIHATIAPTTDLPLAGSLVSGPGRALVTSTATQDTAPYIDLQDAAAARLDGLSAFTAELFFRLDSPGFATLWSSSGSIWALPTPRITHSRSISMIPFDSPHVCTSENCFTRSRSAPLQRSRSITPR